MTNESANVRISADEDLLSIDDKNSLDAIEMTANDKTEISKTDNNQEEVAFDESVVSGIPLLAKDDYIRVQANEVILDSLNTTTESETNNWWRTAQRRDYWRFTKCPVSFRSQFPRLHLIPSKQALIL